MNEDFRHQPKLPFERNIFLSEDRFELLPHFCEIPEKSHCHGPAIEFCFEDLEGYLFVTNIEYGSQVNFCPMCGYKAKKFLSDA